MTDRQARSAKAKEKVATTDFSFATHLTDAAIKHFGPTHVKGFDEFLGSIYGVPIYNNLALQYLVGVDVIPLGRLINVVGPFGVTKSNFCWYLASLFLRYGGYVANIDSERKGNPDQVHNLLRTYLNFDKLPHHREWFAWEPVETLDLLLDFNVWYVKQLETAKQATGLNINKPVLLLNDSLGSVTSEEAGEKRMNDDEIQGFSAARNAAKLSEDMQVFGPRLSELPVTALFINHQKKVLAAPGGGRPSFMPPQKSEKGGDHQRFAYTWIFELNRIGSDKIVEDGVTVKYPKFKFTMKKNATGSERPYIEVPYQYFWKGDTEGSELIWYDWNAALVLLLTDDKIMSKEEVRAVLNITKTRGKYSCDRVGAEGVSITELGAAIHKDPVLVQELQDKVLKIRRKKSHGTLIEGIDRDQLLNAFPATGEEDSGEEGGDLSGETSQAV